MPYFRKTSPFRSRSTFQRGQALVEYVLILIISVSLVIALMNQVFKPFGTFIESYMGSYVGCLLEYGELPTLGSQDESPVDEDSECNSRFEAATLSGGRPPRPGQEGGGRSQNQRNNRERSSSERGGGTYAGSASRGGSSGINRRGPQTGVESGPARAPGKTVEINLSSGSGGAYFNQSDSSSSSVRVSENRRYIAVTGLSDAEKKKLEQKAEGKDKTLITGETLTPKPKKLSVKPPEARISLPPDEPFTLGNFMRVLFIAAIIIAILVFVGGQVLQMSKNDSGD